MSSFSDHFQSELQKLNPQQREAVESLEGPVLVFAGPGTGKTQVLTLRIANLIDQGLAGPENILALTFTKAAAANMQKRLAELIGMTAFSVTCQTFHGFCQEIITAHGEDFPFAYESQVLDELTAREIMEEIIDSLPLQILRPAGDKFHYLKTLLDKINALKQENITVDKYAVLLEAARQEQLDFIAQEQSKKKPRQGEIIKSQKKLQKQEELLLVYTAYQKEIQAKGFHDYADIILRTIDVLKNKTELLSSYQEQFQYLLIDEYQDANNAQSQLAQLLTSYWQDQANIFAVGDAQQSIYRFQGANLENFLHFKKIYPEAKVIELKTGYRCGDYHYQLAQTLFDTAEGEQKLLPVSGEPLQNFARRKGEATAITSYPNRLTELLELAERIQSLHQEGVPWEEMAVLYRNNNESEDILTVLTQYQIPVEIEGGTDVLAQEIINQWLMLWRFFATVDDKRLHDYYLGQILWQPWWNLDPLEIMQVLQTAKKEKQNLLTVMLQTKDKNQNSSKRWTVNKLAQQLSKWLKDSYEQKADRFNQQLMQDSQLLPFLAQQKNYLPLLTYFYSLQKRLQSWVSKSQSPLLLSQALSKIDLMQNHHLKLEAQDLNLGEGAVALATAHKAKGREWQYVFLVGLNKNNWHKKDRQLLPLPEGIMTLQTIGHEEKEDETKRLLFVALTRAKNKTFISWHEQEEEESLSPPKLPSPLVYLLKEKAPSHTWKEVSSQVTGEKTQAAMTTLLQLPPEHDFSVAARRFLHQQAKKLIMSPSVLNAYLEDQDSFWQNYLLDAPLEPTTPAKEFGSSLHFALEKLYQPRTRNEGFLPLDQVQKIFAQDFLQKDIDEASKKSFLALGKQSLAAYIQTYGQTDLETKTLAVEKKFGYQFKLQVQGVPIKGKIDRLDFIDDKHQTLRVIDYKSSSYFSLNALLSGEFGRKKLSEREKLLPSFLQSSIKRQLLFYKLLCQLEPNFPYQVEIGAIDFIKKSSSEKKLVRHQISLPNEEVEALKNLIKEIYDGILSLKFLSID